MTSVDLAGVTSGGVLLEGGGAWDPAFGATDTSALPGLPGTDPGLSTEMVNPGSLPTDTFFPDAAGNILNQDGTIVVPAADVPALFGGQETQTPATLPSPTDAFIQHAGRAPGPGEAESWAQGPEYQGIVSRFGGAAGSPAVPTVQAGPTDVQLQSVAQSIEGQVDPGTLSKITNFLKTDPLGKALATLLVGGAGLGIQQAIAGGGSATIRTPQPPQTAGQKALSDLFANNPAAAKSLQESILAALGGDKTAADVLGQQLGIASAAQAVEGPAQADIRNASLANLQGMQKGAVQPDPVTAALQKELLSISATGTTNPALERTFREQQDRLQNQMYKAEGPSWQQTTPGIDASTKLQESQAIQNYQDWLDTLGKLTGPYQAGVSQAANQSTGLSQLGLPNVPATASALTGIVNPSAVGGVDTTNRAVLTSQAAQDQAALLSAFADQQARQGLGQSIGGLTGRALKQAFSLAA